MKRFSFLSLLLFVYSISAMAQYSLSLYGARFNVEINDQDMTAAICDYNYEIDDAKFPIKNKNHKFSGFGKEQARTVTIPSTFKTSNGNEYVITTIGKAAFAGYSNMDYVVIPPTVTNIEDYAFFRTSLVSVSIPASVARMGNRVFGWCEKLKKLEIPQGIMMGDGLFTESKHCQVSYFDAADRPVEDVASNQKPAAKKPVVNKPKAPKLATFSDVDTDLPTAKKSNDNTFAIIIANENYKQEPRVLCALHDGEVFKEYCARVLGLPEENINLVQNATKNEMMAAVDWATQIAGVYKDDARVIVYYSGHGIPDDASQAAHLLPVDAIGNNPKMAYSLNDLYASLGKLEARDVTVFLDACFSGSDRGDGTVGGHSKSVAIKAKTEEARGNMVVFSAAQGSETAWPYAEKAHGLFTYYLLKALKESKGNMTYGELGDYLTKEVSRRSIVVNKKSQTPCITPSPALSASWQKMTFFK